MIGLNYLDNSNTYIYVVIRGHIYKAKLRTPFTHILISFSDLAFQSDLRCVKQRYHNYFRMMINYINTNYSDFTMNTTMLINPSQQYIMNLLNVEDGRFSYLNMESI